ncbi:hypothetical protein F503_07312 [Ophiostoma piceae UAMH 11346]|uniref:Uncharacterized protein n=1 Tax=Ophiostoma piceae (strain UAMH 11346) TaxID=1262450 RepID=S3CC31_OPHP1|nr:hypothetical protein F503_07312 [Ophiostoma piceae UAMH 11346]
MHGNQLITLRDALARQKPSATCTMAPGPNTRKVSWPEFDDSVTLWSSFNIQCLNESYGSVLDLPLPAYVALDLPAVDELHAVDSGSDEGPRQMMAWTNSVVRPVLTFSKKHLELHKGTALQFGTSGADWGRRAADIVPQLDARTHIDIVIGLNDYAQQSLVLGFGRASSRWRPGSIVSDPSKSKGNLLWPLRQLANLCMLAKCRYGYIQTNESLVAVCFADNPVDKQPAATIKPVAGGKKVYAQFMPVPWNTEHGTSGATLTTEMALWWLCMLSLADRPRGLEPVDKIVPIDTWVLTLLDDGVTWVRRHYYSGVDQPMATESAAALNTGNITVPPASLSSTNVFGFEFNYLFDGDTGSL